MAKIETKTVRKLNERRGVYEDVEVEVRPTKTVNRLCERRGQYVDFEVELTDAEIAALEKPTKKPAKKKAKKKAAKKK